MHGITAYFVTIRMRGNNMITIDGIKTIPQTFATVNMLRFRMMNKGHPRSDRLEKGIHLALYGHVDGNDVHSMESDNTYHITRAWPFFWKFKCTCPDYKHRHEQVGYCKHIYAYIVTRMIGK